MRFWDASALVPLLVAESGSERVRARLAEDPQIVTWGWSAVEIASAVERRTREGTLTRPQRRAVLDRLAALEKAWDEVVDVLAVRGRARSLLARHPLRAVDAAQLGAALLASDPDPATLPFVCLDERLALAAEKEGFPVLGPV